MRVSRRSRRSFKPAALLWKLFSRTRTNVFLFLVALFLWIASDPLSTKEYYVLMTDSHYSIKGEPNNPFIRSQIHSNTSINPTDKRQNFETTTTTTPLLVVEDASNTTHRSSKFFAIHIGPAKTGTTAIQKSAAETFREFLVEDNVAYVGKREDKALNWLNEPQVVKVVDGIHITDQAQKQIYLKTMTCMQRILKEEYDSHNNNSLDDYLVGDHAKQLATNETLRTFLKDAFLEHCWSGEHFKFRYLLETSILDSDEAYSYRCLRTEATDKNVYFEGAKNHAARFWIFDLFGYDRLILVAGYRRYADWIVSAYHQQVKTGPGCLKVEFKPKRKTRKGSQNHHLWEHRTRPCLHFKNYFRPRIRKPNDYSAFMGADHCQIDTSLPIWMSFSPERLEAKILNYFQQPPETTSQIKHHASISSEFFCDAIGEDWIPRACDASKVNFPIAPNASTSEKIVNQGSPTSVVYQQIVAAAYRKGFLLPTDEERIQIENQRLECSESGDDTYWCETTNSCESTKPCPKESKTPFQGTNSSGIQSWKDLSDYLSQRMETSWKEKIPLECLSEKDLNKILAQSLAFEKRMLPEFYKTPWGEAEHRRIFWEEWVQRKRAFCWLDTERLFRNAKSWTEIVDDRMVSYDWK